MLGLDPFQVANEGKMVAAVSEHDADTVLTAMRSTPYGREAVIIGEAHDGRPGRVLATTVIGTTRILDMLTGEQLPRIC